MIERSLNRARTWALWLALGAALSTPAGAGEPQYVGAEKCKTCHGKELMEKNILYAPDYVINAGGYTHTSVALRDALVASGRPFVEVHLSAISAREPFRQVSYFSDIAMGVISGFHGESYMLALQAIINHIDP